MRSMRRDYSPPRDSIVGPLARDAEDLDVKPYQI